MIERSVPYHCAFMLSENGTLKFSIAWRRTGSFDIGIFISSEEDFPGCFFSVGYSPRGEVMSFNISENIPLQDKAWADERVTDEPRIITKMEEEGFSLLSESFWRDWLETFGASEIAELLKKYSTSKADPLTSFSEAFKAHMPLNIRKEKMPDILHNASYNDANSLFALFEEGSSPESGGGRMKDLLESKLRGFMDYL